MKAKDMREKSPADLAEMEKSLVREAFQSRFKNFTNRLDDTSAIKKARRDIARLKTLQGERARGAAPAVATKAAPKAAAAPAVKAKAAPKAKVAPKAKTKKSSEATK